MHVLWHIPCSYKQAFPRFCACSGTAWARTKIPCLSVQLNSSSLASYLTASHDLVQHEGRLSCLKHILLPLISNSVDMILPLKSKTLNNGDNRVATFLSNYSRFKSSNYQFHPMTSNLLPLTGPQLLQMKMEEAPQWMIRKYLVHRTVSADWVLAPLHGPISIENVFGKQRDCC